MGGSDGAFYGTTSQGGSNSVALGTVFRVTTNGLLTTLVHFGGTNGALPKTGLIFGKDGALYGTTYYGFQLGMGNYGTFFRLTTNGVFTLLGYFAQTNGGYFPNSRLLEGKDGVFYGTSTGFGSPLVFQASTNGNLRGLVAAFSDGGLVMDGDGNIYGATSSGGSKGGGIIFRLNTDVEMLPLVRFGGRWMVGVSGYPYATYRIQRATNPAGPWSTLFMYTGNASGLFQYLDTTAPAGSAFYRVTSP
jgi:uncharacterized repeat protein (TIGR03803 family)